MNEARHQAMVEVDEVYGLLAEFETTEQLLEAVHAAYAAGYRRMDSYTPFPVHGLAEAMGVTKTRLPLIVLLGGIAGGVLGYLMQYYLMAVDYPLNIGGRPLHSWPAFIPVTFELTILGAATSAVLGMLALNGLPRPHHPLFNVPEFGLATQHLLFFCIEATDPNFDLVRTEQFLRSLGAREVKVVDV
jgi:hypothetical protein